MPYQDENFGCPAEVGLHMISGKWKPRILYELFQETRRFGELHRKIPEVSRHVLTLQLRELEENGIVKRMVFHELPPKVEYSITEFGRQFEAVLEQMVILGQQYIGSQQDLKEK